MILEYSLRDIKHKEGEEITLIVGSEHKLFRILKVTQGKKGWSTLTLESIEPAYKLTLRGKIYQVWSKLWAILKK